LTGFWVGRMAYTYAPGMIVKVVIYHTIYKVKNVFLGRFLAIVFVAPSVVPTATPIVATISGLVASYLVIVIANLFIVHVLRRAKSQNE